MKISELDVNKMQDKKNEISEVPASICYKCNKYREFLEELTLPKWGILELEKVATNLSGDPCIALKIKIALNVIKFLKEN